MRHMYSHPGEYRKIFPANYLCIGFVPGGNPYPIQLRGYGSSLAYLRGYGLSKTALFYVRGK